MNPLIQPFLYAKALETFILQAKPLILLFKSFYGLAVHPGLLFHLILIHRHYFLAMYFLISRAIATMITIP